MAQKELGLDGHKNIDCFVKAQINKLKQTDESFSSLFEIMFSIKNNVMFEHTDGNKIFETTYGECYEKIKLVASNLIEHTKGIEHNSIIGLNMDNGIEWVHMFWAILMSGHRPLLINKRLSADRLQNVLDEYNIKLVISDDFVFKVKTINPKSLYDNVEIISEYNWADEIILMSSGTSLNLKLCVYKGKNICEQIYNTKDIIKRSKLIKSHYEGKIRILTFLPFYHVFGLVACYMWFAFFSRTFVLLKDLSGETILNTVKKHKVTHIFAVPMLWEKVEQATRKKIKDRGERLEHKFNKGIKISNALQNINSSLGRMFAKKMFKEVRDNLVGDSIQFLISGGGSIAESTLELFNGLGYRLANGYGMTEVGITSVELSNKPKWLNSCSVGKPFNTIQYRIENGNLFIKGSSRADHLYIENKRVDLSEEWFASSDLAKEKNGHYYISGRADDLIVGASGENICPDDVEKKLKIQDAQVVMLALPNDNTKVSALVVSVNKYFSANKLKEIKENLFKALSNNDIGKLVDKIYYTNSQFIVGNDIKINRKKIIQRIESKEMILKEFNEIDTIETTEINKELQTQIAEIFEQTLNKKLTPNEFSQNFFYELGGDSLLYFSIIESIKSKYGVTLPLDMEQIVSVNGLCEFIQDKIN